ncbi:DoxX family protein [Pseudoalteromonas xiamenensis]|uniref:DoxX family protein n=1 Tax=Pseudoalteromonas xiamenensis TaxID=882626 RepID=UPI0035EB0CC7
MNKFNQPALATTILRLSLGVMFLAHGFLKLLVFTPAGTAGFFRSLGLPEFLGPLTMSLELAGGLLLVIGFQVRLVSVLLIPILIGSIVFVHGANGWGFGNAGGGYEYPLFLIMASVVQALLGNGAYAIESRFKSVQVTA